MQITLKAARVNAGMTQPQVSKKLQIALKTLISWEKGRTIPKPVYIEAMCRLYGCNPEDIYLHSNLS